MDRPDIFVRIEVQEDIDLRSASEAEQCTQAYRDTDRVLGATIGQCLRGMDCAVARMSLVIAEAIAWLDEDLCKTDEDEALCLAARKVIDHYDAVDGRAKAVETPA